MATPNTQGDRTPLEELGVKDLDEAKRFIALGRKEHNQSGFLTRRLEELEAKMEDRHEDEDNDQLTDPGMKKLHGEIRQLRKVVSDVVRRTDPEIEKLEPYFDQVRDAHPSVFRDLKDGPTRLAVVRTMAADLYAKEHPEEGKGAPPGGLDQVDPRVHRETGGVSVQTVGGSEPDDRKLQKMLSEAKTDDEKSAIMDDWSQKHFGEGGV